jgi:hypothetical protein
VVIVFLATIAIYLPGLFGGYAFDDFPNIVDNTRLHVSSLAWPEWKAAAFSSPSSDLQRPLASLSFALNFYFSGLDPLPMKAVNVAIHLFNGWLLYLLILQVGKIAARSEKDLTRDRWLASIVTGAWLLHPINLTSVLYVVQRMESLANVFVLGGLLLYVKARIGQRDRKRGSSLLLWIGFPLLTAIGILAKETAALLPLYAAILEFTIMPACASSRERRGTLAFFGIFLIAPAILGLIWLIPHVLSPTAFSTRSFTLGQRLLTEPRVIADYVGWTLFPMPQSFTFYHDAFPISRSILEPWTTLLAIAFLGAVAAAAIVFRLRRPLFALGVLWFFAAQTLTATIIPLELIFEHRNYFASAGLLLAATDLMLPRNDRAHLPLARNSIIAAFLLLCVFSLWMRVYEWSGPIRLALAESMHNPTSPRAGYEYARTLVVLSGYRKDSPLVPEAFRALTHTADMPDAGILPDVGLIILASRTDNPVNAEWWENIRKKLTLRQPNVEDGEALKSLTACQREGHCVLDDSEMLKIYLAAANQPAPSASTLYSYAIFAFNRLHDRDLALQLVKDAVQRSPKDQQYRANLINFLIALGKFDEAKTELSRLKANDRFGSMAPEIEKAEADLSGKQ